MSLPIRLYPPVKVTGQSFDGVKRMTTPNQSLSLREIIRRFVRSEPLPVSKEGIYEERFGDLEKISKEDITVQMDRIEELKSQIAAFNKRVKDKEDADKLERDRVAKETFDNAVKAAASTPVGGTPLKSPPLQGS